VFTQCSKCETVFQVSPDILRVAGGQVRCGNCGEVFNALARLEEDSSVFNAGESAFELETRAESILESIVPAQAAEARPTDFEEFAPPGVEIASIEVLDWPEEETQEESADVAHRDTEADDRSLEFTLPPGELDRIFVESKKSAQSLHPAAETSSQIVAQPAPRPVSQSAPQSDAQPATHAESQPVAPAPEPMPVPSMEAPPSMAPEAQAAPEAPEIEILLVPESEVAPPPHPESAFIDALPARSRVSGFEVPDDVRRDMLAGFEQHILKARHASPRRASPAGEHNRPFTWWLSAAIVLSLLLLAQLVHQNREWFVSNAQGPFGGVVRGLYGALGSPLPAPANLSAYQLRQWGVTGDPDANGTLHLRASILNGAAQLQPYPLLRVSLADRFGKSIGSRDFEPSEYMGKPTARLLAPGERADVSLQILDPGKNAEGFEVDVCLRGVGKRISCANDAAAQTKP
jgi:predicted Zn finger-like uncharacterized protein